MPARSRNVFSADCASGIREAFIADPTTRPDTRCLSDLDEVLPIDFLPPRHRTQEPGPGEAVIRTVAGDGAYGSSGDDNLATRAQLAGPDDVVVDAEGNLYIVEYDGGRVRRVDSSSGRISTVVGAPTGVADPAPGEASSVDLRGSSALAIDTDGNLYVGGGSGGHRMIIRVALATGEVTTIAGTGEKGFSGDGGPAIQAEVSWVRDIDLDDEGNVFFSDYENHRIRKVDTAGVITTVAGTGEPGFSGDGGPATQAKINHPSGVWVDDHGNVYFADRGNDRVRRIDRHGVISTVAGNGRRGYSGDGGPAIRATVGAPYRVAVDDRGNLYVGSRDCGCIRKIGGRGIGILSDCQGFAAPF